MPPWTPPTYVAPGTDGSSATYNAEVVDNLIYLYDHLYDIPHSDVGTVTTGPTSTTSGSYVNWPPANVCQVTNFVKRRADTMLIVETHATCYVTAAATVTFGFRVNNVDYDTAALYIGLTYLNFQMSGVRKVTGLAAGTYTVTMRAKVSGGVTMTTDTRHSMLVTETL
jgi:hypothetical protein